MGNPFANNQSISRNTLPSFRYRDGEDFSLWQEKAREKLKELLGLPYRICQKDFRSENVKEYPDHSRIYFTYMSEPGYSVPGCCCIPKEIKDGSPVVICLQGHSTGMHRSLGETKYPSDSEKESGDRDFAMQAVRQGYIAIAIEQRCFGQCGGKENGDTNCQQSSLAALMLGRTTIGERVWDVSNLIDLVKDGVFPEAKDRKICLTGNSGGGTATFYASCLDNRIDYVMPSCAVCTFDDSILNVPHCVCNYIPGIKLFFDMGDLGGLIAPRPLVVVAGEKDDIFPIGGTTQAFSEIKRFYKAAGAENKCRLVVGPGGHRYYADIAWGAMNGYLFGNGAEKY